MSGPLLIFDCDGVLIDSEAIYIDVELEVLRSLGVTVDRRWYMREFMALAQDTWRSKYENLVEEQTGRPLGEDGYRRVKDESRARVLADLKPVAGVEAMLSRLDQDRCVASSTKTALLHRKLEQVGFDRYFGDAIYSGDMVANGKPAPDLYLYAAAQTGHAPAECVVIEDSANGVIGGKSAGMFVIGFTGGTHCIDGHGDTLRAAGADIVLNSHPDLARWLQNELARA